MADCPTRIKALIQTTWDHAHQLEFQTASNLPVVSCDPLALQNAVVNLLLNARDAMPNGGVISICATGISLDSEEWIEIRIVDSGVGMSPNTLAQAFDSFFTTKYVGLGGVGLHIVDRFVQDARGHVLIESEYGLGTIVKTANTCVIAANGFAPCAGIKIELTTPESMNVI